MKLFAAMKVGAVPDIAPGANGHGVHGLSQWAPSIPPFPTDAVVDPDVSARMSRHPRRNTSPEMRLRREVHRRGLRYRVDASLPGLPRRRADLLFTKKRIAVFVDGCFWHNCPQHGRPPGNNAGWWSKKLEGNMARDQDTNRHLLAQGWTVLRFWEHQDMAQAADVVEQLARAPQGERLVCPLDPVAMAPALPTPGH